MTSQSLVSYIEAVEHEAIPQQGAAGIKLAPTTTGSTCINNKMEDLSLVKRSALFHIAVRILDHDIGVLGNGRTKLPRLYESVLRGTQDRVLLEHAVVKRKLRASGVRIYAENYEPSGLEIQYVCRGYHHRFMMNWEIVKVESEEIIRRIIEQKR